MLHVENAIIIILQFAKNCMSISSKLRTQEEVKNVSSKRNTLYYKFLHLKPSYFQCLNMFLLVILTVHMIPIIMQISAGACSVNQHLKCDSLCLPVLFCLCMGVLVFMCWG